MENRYDIYALFIDIISGKIASINFTNRAKLRHYS